MDIAYHDLPLGRSEVNNLSGTERQRVVITTLNIKFAGILRATAANDYNKDGTPLSR